jgi:thiol-disulfide isomerase/thioredoxin
VSVAQDVVEGREYKLIVPAQPPESSGKIEVIEFFSYACPHCAEFEPDLQAWIKRKPKDVEYRAMPMVFRPEWKPPAKLFFTLEAMGVPVASHFDVGVAGIHRLQSILPEIANARVCIVVAGMDGALPARSGPRSQARSASPARAVPASTSSRRRSVWRSASSSRWC